MYAVIVENDISEWDDKTGSIYHFPSMYKKILVEGVEVVYYKGRVKDKKFSPGRLSDDPHYFGKGIVSKVYPDERSSKSDFFAVIDKYVPFSHPVMAKVNGSYFESIPETRARNYWRSAVRRIDYKNYESIIEVAGFAPAPNFPYPAPSDEIALESRVEGEKKSYYGERYERDLKLRQQAIAVHGLVCKVCGFDFEIAYGVYAKGYIHIHHVTPISDFDGPKFVDPKKDLIPLCANCHSIIHRKRDATLSVEDLKAKLRVRWMLKE